MSKLALEVAKQLQKQETSPPRDCGAVAASGLKESGVYTIHPASCSSRYSVQVWCEMEEAGGGWTVIQRRGIRQPNNHPNTPVDFFRNWAEYKWGFGDLEGEHWLGNEYLHQLTTSGDHDLRVDLMDWNDESSWAEFKHAFVESEERNYTLHIGDYRGTAGNSLKYHQGAAFSTKDRDNDSNPRGHCARTFHGGWWFTSCHEVNLNGRYHKKAHNSYGDGINWQSFRGLKYSLKFSRIMIRASVNT